MSTKRKPAWDNYKDRVAKKRTQKDKGANPNLTDGLTVQRLSANVEGKCQKYSRIGPLTLVPFQQDLELTLENIKAACKTHFCTELECDVLAGERGPSYTDISQIKNWKVVHVRFVESLVHPTSTKKQPFHQSEPLRGSPRKTVSHIPPKSVSVAKSSVVPSISLSQMLKLGKVIAAPEVDIVTLKLEEFSLTNMEWLNPVEVKISLERKPFAEGAFREAYMAKSIAGLPKGNYVLKKYKESEKQGIEVLFGSIEAHTRKSVQLNALARNFAQNMAMEVPLLEFGQTFSYNKVYFSSLNNEHVTLESHLDGTFKKYINNTGEMCVAPDDVSEISHKAETYVHYTYVKSQQQLMVTDIQGVDYTLCDPEVASSELKDPDDNSFRFCTGNLSFQAIDKFLSSHVCNNYCKMLKLSI